MMEAVAGAAAVVSSIFDRGWLKSFLITVGLTVLSSAFLCSIAPGDDLITTIEGGLHWLGIDNTRYLTDLSIWVDRRNSVIQQVLSAVMVAVAIRCYLLVACAQIEDRLYPSGIMPEAVLLIACSTFYLAMGASGWMVATVLLVPILLALVWGYLRGGWLSRGRSRNIPSDEAKGAVYLFAALGLVAMWVPFVLLLWVFGPWLESQE